MKILHWLSAYKSVNNNFKLWIALILTLSSNSIFAQAQPDSSLYIDRSGNTILGANLSLKGDLISFGKNGVNPIWFKANNDGFTIGHSGTSNRLSFNSHAVYTENQDLNLAVIGTGNMHFKTNGNYAMMINQAGNVSIGNKGRNPIHKVEIDGALHMDGNPIYLRQDPNNLNDYIKWTGLSNSSGNTNDKVRVSGWRGVILGSTYLNTTALSTNSDGFVGIGTDNAQKPFQVDIKNVGMSLMVSSAGFTGIGTSDSQFPLHVATTQGGANISYRANGSPGVAMGWGSGVHDASSRNYKNCSIFAYGDIVTKNAIVSSGTAAYSDIRLKKDFKLSSSKQDLEKLKQIEIVNYKMIDTIADQKSYKKVIAQQVQKVFPMATNVSFSTLPNVFQTAVSIKKLQDSLYLITLAKPQSLKVGDQLELKCQPANDVLVQVTAVNKNTITIKSAIELNQQESVFVYGTKATDVLTVDYDAISMLNVSATQELSKIIDRQQKKIEDLTQEVERLKKEQTNTNQQILARLTQLEESKTTPIQKTTSPQK
ncbi:hypothetical protein FA048_16500 [Pedobacter polaris]|uniref:Peptidase S74 domain-containing protein n=1 Tax=Pedobacter polaris TaxID=2571273 RepID=A0A4U1CIU7_9SPHI|nr:tail fiber domain-containing protein [Pedobacter polaris]TKC06797.1 hypothetical protein FA048_16500 [Pedobacter polaris]